MRKRYLVFIAFAIALATAAYWKVSQRNSVAATPADMVPFDAAWLVHADLTTLRNSPWGSPLTDAAASSGLLDACSKGVVDRLHTLTVWGPSESPSSFALHASTSLTADVLWKCTKESIAHRGGIPARETHDQLEVMFDRQLGLDGASISLTPSGALTLARPDARRRMRAVEQGQVECSRKGRHGLAHAKLGPADIVLSALVDDRLRSSVSRWVGEDTSILQETEVVGLALKAGTITTMQLWVSCKAQTGCNRLEEHARARVANLQKSMELRILAGSWIDGLAVSRESDGVRVRVEAPTQALLELWRNLEGSSEPPSPVAPSASGSSGFTF